MNERSDQISESRSTWILSFLSWVERTGNRLPDSAVLFLLLLFVAWGVSALLSGYTFTIPSSDGSRELAIQNQLTGTSLAAFLANIVTPLMP